MNDKKVHLQNQLSTLRMSVSSKGCVCTCVQRFPDSSQGGAYAGVGLDPAHTHTRV